VQSTPFTKAQAPGLTNRYQQLNFEPNLSPITRKSRSNSRNTSVVMQPNSLEKEDDEFDVEIRKIPASPRVPSTCHSGNPFDDKRISLQTFEAFERSLENDNDFEKMLNNFTKDSRFSVENGEKMRQSLDNIKKRHSLLNLEKQQADISRRKELEIDNRLQESMNRSMTSSSGSERLLNRRSRIYEDVSVVSSTSSAVVTSSEDATEQEQEIQETNGASNDQPSTANVEGNDRKNRDRFKTIRINRKRDEGVPKAPEIEDDDMESAQEFTKIDVNSPKPANDVFKMPQPISRPELKLRSLSKPRTFASGLQRKDLTLPLSNNRGSTDNLENDKPEQYAQPMAVQRMPAKQSLIVPTTTLKSPMGTKSKSIHNLVFNSGSNSSLNKIPSKVGSKLSSYGYNNEVSQWWPTCHV
jgi:hypothetical protein